MVLGAIHPRCRAEGMVEEGRWREEAGAIKYTQFICRLIIPPPLCVHSLGHVYAKHSLLLAEARTIGTTTAGSKLHRTAMENGECKSNYQIQITKI